MDWTECVIVAFSDHMGLNLIDTVWHSESVPAVFESTYFEKKTRDNRKGSSMQKVKKQKHRESTSFLDSEVSIKKKSSLVYM